MTIIASSAGVSLVHAGGSSWLVVFRFDCVKADVLRQLGLARWNKAERVWETHSSKNADALADMLRSGRFKALVETRQALLEQGASLSAAHDADVEVPVPNGLAYFGYQKATAAFARNRDGVLVADEMGLGKTIQAIAAINDMQGARRGLVICPNSVKLNWARELRKWLVSASLRSGIAVVTSGKTTWPKRMATGIIIINQDIAWKHRHDMRQGSWDFVVIDEAHGFKNDSTQRGMAIYGYSEPQNGGKPKRIGPLRAKKKLMLTGTPLVNNPSDIYPLAHWLCPSEWPTKKAFMDRYWDQENKSAKNLDELQTKLRGTVMIRRLKADVQKDLPAKLRQLIEFPPTREVAAELAIATKEVLDQVEAVKRLREAARSAKAVGGKSDYREAVAQLRQSQADSLAEISRLRKRTALLKLPIICDHLKSTVLECGKMVLFAHHREVIEELEAMMHGIDANPVKLYGGLSPEQRQEAIDRFQNDRACQVFIGSISAAGVGITLTAASRLAMIELPWTPAELMQAEDRCHRIGQQDTVFVQHLVLEGSLDAKIASLLIHKQEMADAALDTEHLALDAKESVKSSWAIIEAATQAIS